MATGNFPQCNRLVRISEGGNDDDPDDSGGRTSRGITQREYTAWLREKGRPNLDVWKAPDADISAIYYEEYWMPLCESMPLGIDYVYYDLKVNGGVGRANKMLQATLGVTQDGRIGPVTRAALAKAEPVAFIKKFSQLKADWYRNIAHGHNAKYLRGWLNRTADVQSAALKMVKGS